MRVRELIARLEEMPEDAEVKHVWDGEARTDIEFVWLSKKGDVITIDTSEPVYSNHNLPKGLDVAGHVRTWYTPSIRCEVEELV